METGLQPRSSADLQLPMLLQARRLLERQANLRAVLELGYQAEALGRPSGLVLLANDAVSGISQLHSFVGLPLASAEKVCALPAQLYEQTPRHESGAFLFPDVQSHPQLALACGHCGFAVAAPLALGGRQVGWLWLLYHSPQSPSQSVFELMHVLGGLLAGAMLVGEQRGEPQEHRLVGAPEQFDRLRKTFLVMAGHELRAPLASIKGYAQLMLHLDEQKQLSSAMRRAVEAVAQQVERGLRIVDNLIEASLVDTSELQPHPRSFDVVELVRQVVASQQLLAGKHSLHYAPPAEPLTLNADSDLIEQLLINLINNACKYSPDGGEVVIRSERKPCAEIASALPPASAWSAEWLALSVADSGLGIAPEEQERVFDRFYRANDAAARSVGGLGLGLYLCQAIARAHGGVIRLKSALRGGSVFTVYLPLK